MFWDATYLLVVIGALISTIATWNVQRTFRRFSQCSNSRGLTGERAAALLLQEAGIYDVRIEPIRGSLTDHYSPREKVLRLSESVYYSTSVSAVGVAAHECGHAIQHQEGYLPLTLRSISVPMANIGSQLSWPLILLGLVFGWGGLADLGVLLFTFVILFQFLTLPVEFNASRRALWVLEEKQLLVGEELDGAAKVLTAAALTYVAALFSSMLQLLRLLLLTRRDDKRR